MTKPYFEARFAGHLVTDPRLFMDGQACELRIEIALPTPGRGGDIYTALKKVKVKAWDTATAEFLAETFSARDFVEVRGVFEQVESAWQIQQGKDAGKWVSGMAVFRLVGIRHVPTPVAEAAEEPEVPRVLAGVA